MVNTNMNKDISHSFDIFVMYRDRESRHGHKFCTEQNSPSTFYWDLRQNVKDDFTDNHSVCDCTFGICVITLIWDVFVVVFIFSVHEQTRLKFPRS